MATPSNEAVIEIKPASTTVAFASPDRLKPAMPFETAKGSLRLPAQGRRMKRFGDADAEGSTFKGISMQTRPEARITRRLTAGSFMPGSFAPTGSY